MMGVAAKQGAAQRDADQADAEDAQRFEEFSTRMDERCSVVREIMAPLIEANGFVKAMVDVAAASVKNNYPVRLPVYVIPSFNHYRTGNYLNSQLGARSENQWDQWRNYTDIPGAFVAGRHHKAMNQDSEVKIILGLCEVTDGNYSNRNFISRSEKSVPGMEMDILVSCGNEPSYRVKYTDAEKLELLGEKTGNRLTLHDHAPSYTPKMSGAELAEFIYGRVFKTLNVDLRSFFKPAEGSAPVNQLPVSKRELP